MGRRCCRYGSGLFRGPDCCEGRGYWRGLGDLARVRICDGGLPTVEVVGEKVYREIGELQMLFLEMREEGESGLQGRYCEI